MMLKRSVLVLMVVSGGFLAACHPSASGRSAAKRPSAKDAGPVIADVAGQAVTLSEVDFRAAGRLAIRELVAECGGAVRDETFWRRWGGPESFENWNRPEDHETVPDA